MSAEKYANWLVKNKDKKGTPEFEKVAEAYRLSKQTEVPAEPQKTRVEQYMERNARLPREYGEEASFVESMGRGMMDVYQGGKQLAMNVLGTEGAEDYNKQLQNELELYDKNNPNFQFGRLAGNIATPLSLLPASAGASAGARGASLLGAGGVFGAMQPVADSENFFQNKAAQAATGAALAPVLPLAGKAAGAVKRGVGHLTRPFSDKGITQDLSELFRKEALGESGSDASINKIIDAVQNRKTYVPGNVPTAGQAIADVARETGDDFGAGLVRLEKDLSREVAEGQALRAQTAAQEAARKSAIGSIAGTPEKMAAAEAARRAAADPLYEKVAQSQLPVDIGPVVNKIDDILFRNPNESKITRPLLQIKKKLDEGGVSPRALQSLSKEIRDMSGIKSASGQREFSTTALNSVKKSLDAQIGRTEAAFRAAQKTYKRKSKPINQMQVGKELAKALETPLDQETAATYMNAVRNAPRTIKRSVDVGIYDDLGDILSADQIRNVENVANELLRGKQQAQMASRVKPIFGELETSIEPRLPRVLERSVVIANHILKKIGVDKSKDYQRVAIDILQNPEKLVPLLRMSEQSIERKIAMEFVKQMSAQVPAQTGGRAVGLQQ